MQNNQNMQRFSKNEVENEDKLQQFGDQYCKNAIYKNDNGEFETCMIRGRPPLLPALPAGNRKTTPPRS